MFTITIVGFLLTIGFAFLLSMRRQRPGDRNAIPVMIVDDDKWEGASHHERPSPDRDPLGTAESYR